MSAPPAVLRFVSPALQPIFRSPSPTPASFHGSLFLRTEGKWNVAKLSPACKAISKPYQTQENTLVYYNNGSVVKELVSDELEEDDVEACESKEVKDRVDFIQVMLGSMGDGEITVSPYDTAWVALVERVDGSGGPQFPESLQWISDNQLPDGSWGDVKFVAHDRMINTLACVIALRRWNAHPKKCDLGMRFVENNMKRLEEEEAEHMPIGFEVAFPSLIETARDMGIEVSLPEDTPALREIHAKRDLKLTRIPWERMHEVATTLLHSLEGMKGLEWEKLLRLRCADGSFLFSPSATAYALMHTGDRRCLDYLRATAQRFHGGVPNVYPVDLFEHLWAVDRLERLGISRYFRPQIEDCVDYVYRHWTERGICWARNTVISDIDDTAMGFRILRLHGRHVSSGVFAEFKRGGEFVCFPGQSSAAVTGMFNLYRAAQVAFPGEPLLHDARRFSRRFLRRKQAAGELLDKWIILKDLPGEVCYALDVPWYASLPRVEARFYIEQYGGQDDVWIGKTLYRMPYVNNDTYLELAKLDFNKCQTVHQLEWNDMQRWWLEKCNIGEYGVSKRSLLRFYFVAAAAIFEPERRRERAAWAKTETLMQMVSSYFEDPRTSDEQRRAFVQEFVDHSAASAHLYNKNRRRVQNDAGRRVLVALLHTLNHLTVETLVAHGADIRRLLCTAWERWLTSCLEHGAAEIIVRTVVLTSGRHWGAEEVFYHPKYTALSRLTDGIRRQLRHFQSQKEAENENGGSEVETGTAAEMESDMEALVEMVVCSSGEGDAVDSDLRHTFLAVAKASYYTAYCSPEVVGQHISKVLFEPVV